MSKHLTVSDHLIAISKNIEESSVLRGYKRIMERAASIRDGVYLSAKISSVLKGFGFFEKEAPVLMLSVGDNGALILDPVSGKSVPVDDFVMKKDVSEGVFILNPAYFRKLKLNDFTFSNSKSFFAVNSQKTLFAIVRRGMCIGVVFD